jgi:DNA (cytosine-5)-methyltransferase 1
MAESLVGIDLFAGAGGMSLGAVLAGIEVVLAVELDPWAARTYHTNHPETEICEEDIRSLSSRRLKSIPKGRKTVVFGGPPCQGFSYSNLRTRSSKNPENWLYLEFLRVVEALSPEWVVFENVCGIVNTAGGLFVKEVIDRLSPHYTLSYGLLNAMHHGVPQNRARFFLVGSRSGVRFRMPRPSRSEPVTVHEAISDLPVLANGAAVSWMPYRTPSASRYARRMRDGQEGSSNHLVTRNADNIVKRYSHVPQGGNWEDIPARMMRNYTDRSRCHTGIYHRLRYDTPSVVIGNFRKNMLIHPEQDRGLSVREAARIQSFPDSYEFQGSIGFQQQQVGNAVPPLLAKAVFHQVVRLTGQCNQ